MCFAGLCSIVSNGLFYQALEGDRILCEDEVLNFSKIVHFPMSKCNKQILEENMIKYFNKRFY